jgi:putative colanic acid biosynthesis acetyltransferase WcaF
MGTLCRRFVWQYLCQPVFWLTPGPFSRAKVLLLRIWGARVGSEVLIRSGVRVLMPWNLVIGDAVAIGTGANLYNFAEIRISDQVVISQNAFLCTGTHDYESPTMPLCSRPIFIGAYVWIAANAFVGPGVTVGEGGVIGAFSVVTGDTPAWTVMAGNPARRIKSRIVKQAEPGSESSDGGAT